MPVYKYYALFEPNEKGAIHVTFPDIPECDTYGEDMIDAFEMAEDAISGYLFVAEDEKKKLKSPSSVKDIKLSEGSSLVLIEVNTDDFR